MNYMKEKFPFHKVKKSALYFLLILLVFYKCPFKFFLGVPCFGCGMTRALMSCLHFDFNAAFSYHPLFGFVIITALIWCLNRLGIKTISRQITIPLLVTLCALFIIVYFIRLFIGSDIVYIDFTEGIIYKILQYFNH